MKTMMRKRSVTILALGLLLALTAALFPIGSARAAAEADNTFTTTAAQGSALKAEPAVIFEVDDSEDLATLESAEVAPTIVMLTVDYDMKVVLNDKTQEFKTVYDTYIKGKSIPAVRIKDDLAAQKFIDYMKNTYYIQDIMAVTNSFQTLTKIYEDDVCFAVNGVYDISHRLLSENRYEDWGMIAEANMAGSNILMVNAGDPNVGTIAKYAASLGKVCWGYAKETGKTEAVAAIAGGCYGVAGKSLIDLQNAVKTFSEDGHARTQFLAAHRGITAYANENSLTALAAAANEGATHVEVDLQVTSDGKIVLCHNSDASQTSNAPTQSWLATTSLAKLQSYRLNDFSDVYGETFPTLEQAIEALIDTDVIFVFELKFDNGSELAVNTLKAIQKMYSTIAKYPKMTGRWMTITFFEPYALQMREICPEIPVGFLGFAKADNGLDWEFKPAKENQSVAKVSDMIRFLRKYNMMLDMTCSNDTFSTIGAYLARGYVQNTWTFEDVSHFMKGVNIATTNKAEECAFLVKEVCPANVASITKVQLASGKIKVECMAYNGWTYEYDCKVIVVQGDPETDKEIKAVLYYKQSGAAPYGIYSDLVTLTVA